VFHIATAILTGASICCCYRFEPELALNTVEREKTTLTMAAATVYTAFLNSCDVSEFDLSSMRLWSSGGMAVSKALEKDWRKATGHWIYVAWGLTETTSPATLWPYPYKGEDLPLDNETMIVSSGIPVFNTELKLIDDKGKTAQGTGEICVRGKQVIDEYWKNPKATSETIVDGWLLTGDVAKIVGGWVYIIDRKKDVINASGFKVWPREVEEVLYEHPNIAEAAVIGVPDPYRGETVKAFIKLKRSVSVGPELRKNIEEFCRRKLASYKLPKLMEFVDEVPKTASGKILRRAFKSDAGTMGDSA
jgi:long-chain acyl-CoA synthetase